jgi:hypothetical protein
MQYSNQKNVISATPADIGSPQVNFNRKRFDDFISDKGSNCYIERALRCPCAQEPTGQGLPDCLNCAGTGWFFIGKQESVVTTTSMSNKSKIETWSETNIGIVNISCRAQDKLGFMDRITMFNLESWFTQVLKLKPSTTKVDKYFSFLVYEPVSVFEVYLFLSSDVPLQFVEKDVYYTIENNKIVFDKAYIDGLNLPSIPSITIRYTHAPTYHIIDINRDVIKQQSINDTSLQTENLPLNCIGRRAHYVIGNPNYNGTGLFDNTNYAKTNTKYDYL